MDDLVLGLDTGFMKLAKPVVPGCCLFDSVSDLPEGHTATVHKLSEPEMTILVVKCFLGYPEYVQKLFKVIDDYGLNLKMIYMILAYTIERNENNETNCN